MCTTRNSVNANNATKTTAGIVAWPESTAPTSRRTTARMTDAIAIETDRIATRVLADTRSRVAGGSLDRSRDLTLSRLTAPSSRVRIAPAPEVPGEPARGQLQVMDL